MVDKKFVSQDTIRNNGIKLAWKLYSEGFMPDVIYVVLRGGVILGNIVCEVFKILKRDDRPVFYAAVMAHSYEDVYEHGEIRVDGWTYDPRYLRKGDKVLLVDDTFDSGQTLNHLADTIIKQGVPRKDIKVAVHDYKHFPNREPLPIIPDYYCVKYIMNEEKPTWLHYLNHELVGLTEEERQKYYWGPEGDQELKEILDNLLKTKDR